jgi:hypothetical protein
MRKDDLILELNNSVPPTLLTLQLVGFSEDAERCGTTSSTTRAESPTIARVLPVLLNTICRTLNSTSGFIFTDLKSFLERREAELEVLPLREESEC